MGGPRESKGSYDFSSTSMVLPQSYKSSKHIGSAQIAGTTPNPTRWQHHIKTDRLQAHSNSLSLTLYFYCMNNLGSVWWGF